MSSGILLDKILPVLPHGWQRLTVVGDGMLALVQLAFAFVILRFFFNNIVGHIVVPMLARELASRDKGRAARVQTLAGVVRSSGNYLLTFILVLVALKKLGVDTTPVLASAGVLGLAVGFGSQKLVRDVTTGFFLLAENQFDVGDYVTIGTVTGIVEDVGMRTTRVRDEVGKIYIIPNGDISLVCNHSTGQMRITLDVTVAANETLERVRAAVAVASERLESEFGEHVLERPQVEGITAWTGTQMTLRIRYRAVL
ncbi:MAG TPA: mechanosensitive ion channel domain-containing protein, partial [Armatimonadota bacterium]|nr:mechanosensitive ion channel domain-containing protein [Armatimonadota bacterium]